MQNGRRYVQEVIWEGKDLNKGFEGIMQKCGGILGIGDSK